MDPVIINLLLGAMVALLGYLLRSVIERMDKHIQNASIHQNIDTQTALYIDLQHQLESQEQLVHVRLEHIRNTMDAILDELQKKGD